MSKKKYFDKLKEYHFEFKHLTVLFIILMSFQIIISLINKASIRNFLSSTQEWYQKDSAEELANLTTTSFELLLESLQPKEVITDDERRRIVQSFNIIFSQQSLQHNLKEICIIVKKGKELYAIDDGDVLFELLFNKNYEVHINKAVHQPAVNLYKSLEQKLMENEEINSIMTDKQTFNVYVPFVLRGEYIGALYMRLTPDFSFITDQIISSYDETSVIYLSLILLGLLAMYFISSYTVKERDDAQKLLFDEHETNLKKEIDYQKELLFTKRIYHTHHKAEKVMGFIKEDLRFLSPENINEVKHRVSKYSNFISRVIYDMKWYDPPVQTIRNTIFQTDLNEVIKFIVDHIFLRISTINKSFNIELKLEDNLPVIPINEFVIWEIIEPLIQNSIDHSGEQDITIIISTCYDPAAKVTSLSIEDNGKGIMPEMLQRTEDGIKKLFLNNITSKKSGIQNSGYGCYIAYEMCKRCGWEIDAENLPQNGSIFTIKFKN